MSFRIALAEKPRKIPMETNVSSEINVRAQGTIASLPATTQSCQNMTKAPRMRAGAISAE